MSSAPQIIQKLIADQRERATKLTDGQWVAVGLLAVAQSLDSVSTSIDNVAGQSEEVAKALSSGLGDIEVALSRIAEALPSE